MLRHYGIKRTYIHNFRLAVLLCLTAGFVNAVGFLGFFHLTTNVTGHAAIFAERVAQQDWKIATIVATWMLLFLGGALFSSLIINKIGHHARFSYVIPILIELAILIFCAVYGGNRLLFSNGFFVGCLLFAMGIQNALVSVISGSVVRTTHLTGTFTDLGIDIAQLRWTNLPAQQELVSRIKLRLSINFFFMLGALAGAYFYIRFSFNAFLLPCLILCFILLFDVFRLHFKRYYRTLYLRTKPKLPYE